MSVYPLLGENLDKLDENLGLVLEEWASQILLYSYTEEAYHLVLRRLFLNLVVVIAQFPWAINPTI